MTDKRLRPREADYSIGVEMVSDIIFEAKKDLLETLQGDYPEGSLVRVIHYGGDYLGHVVGHRADGARIEIKNCKSGKISRRWYRDVEIVVDRVEQLVEPGPEKRKG